MSNQNGIIPFYHDVNDTVELSNSMYDLSGRNLSYNVTAIDAGVFFANILRTWKRPADGKVLTKVDIEAAEYSVLPSILGHGVLCFFDVMFIEYHIYHVRNRVPELTVMIDLLPKMLEYVKNYTSGCNVKLMELDDETYMGCREVPCSI